MAAVVANTRIYLVRHAESAPSPDVPEPEWPLSGNGRTQAEALVPVLAELTISAVYSSPYPRAVDTIQPFADQAGLAINPMQDLRERRLSSGMVPRAQLREWLEKAWAEFDWAPPGGESSAQCQRRVAESLLGIAKAHPGKAILAVSHGNAIALFLNSIDPAFGFEEWAALSNPDLFLIPYGEDGPESFERIAL